MNKFFINSSAFACAALSVTAVHADLSDEVYVLDDFCVTAGPLARPIGEYASPFSSLDESAIQNSSANSIGQLLEGLPGVSATSYGAGASRPVIRGLDGPRVSVLESGLGSLDVAITSPDHAVTIEPLLVDRVEILRGPSALLYGGAAIGGVVNVISKEMPRERVASDTVTGALETRFDSVSDGETFLGYATTGGEDWAVSFTGLERKAENYSIPDGSVIHEEEEGHDEEEEEHEEGPTDILADSYLENSSYSIGATHFFGERNYIGASFSKYDSYYGVPGHAHEEHEEEGGAEEEEEEHGVYIDLLRERFDLEVALFDPTDWIAAARVRFGISDYTHTEYEEDHATVFDREGWELRADAAHNAWSIFDHGVIGAQILDADFLAAGEEEEHEGEEEGEHDEHEGEAAAFGPASETQNQAIFLSEHMHNGAWHFEVGGRLESQQVEVDKTEDATLKDYDDTAYSLAASVIYDLNDNDTLAISLQRSQRHPNSTELYANGPHHATSQFEIGDDDLGVETAYTVDLSYRLQRNLWNANLTVFYTQFDNHIFSSFTGEYDMEEHTENGVTVLEEGLPKYAYVATDAKFYGFEAEFGRQLVQTDSLQMSAKILMDSVRAENKDTGANLPRIPPFRVGGEIMLESGPWEGSLLVRRVFKQDRIVAAQETETAAYTDLRLEVAYKHALAGGDVLSIFARGDNLLDEVIRHHSSFVKDKAPLPGRNLMVGARVQF
jgi:iron complex outermembrane receptor protein